MFLIATHPIATFPAMNSYRHPAHDMPFHELLAGLENEVSNKNVNAKDGPDGLRMYSYSDRCVYERNWNTFSLMARGLILHPETRKIVATPFTKFFNYGERQDQIIPDEPFEVFGKIDGSLIIIYHHARKWNAATRGSFTSDQARWAQDILDASDTWKLVPGITYLAEAVYPENRIVVSYEQSGLFMLAAFAGNGYEMESADLFRIMTPNTEGWFCAPMYSFPDVAALLQTIPTLPGDEEGFVLRFASGLRLKFKGEEYRRLHKCIAGVTPLALWEVMKQGGNGKGIGFMRMDIPEEFWVDFDAITNILYGQIYALETRIMEQYKKVADLSDKELGLNLALVPADVQGFMFAWRKAEGSLHNFHSNPRAHAKLYDAVRPTGNRLDGYRPSSAMNRVQASE